MSGIHTHSWKFQPKNYLHIFHREASSNQTLMILTSESATSMPSRAATAAMASSHASVVALSSSPNPMSANVVNMSSCCSAGICRDAQIRCTRHCMHVTASPAISAGGGGSGAPLAFTKSWGVRFASVPKSACNHHKEKTLSVLSLIGLLAVYVCVASNLCRCGDPTVRAFMCAHQVKIINCPQPKILCTVWYQCF